MDKHSFALVSLAFLSACSGSTALSPSTLVDASDADVEMEAQVDGRARPTGVADAEPTDASSSTTSPSQLLDATGLDVATGTQSDGEAGPIGVTDAAPAEASSTSTSPADGGCPTSNSDADSGIPLQVDQADAVRVPASAISPDVLAAAVTANNAFSLDVYSRLLENAGSNNVVAAPLSASLALTMAYAGAGGQTAAQMATALHFDPDAGSIFDGQNAMIQALDSRQATALAAAQQSGAGCPSPSDYELQIVNSIWGQQTYTWTPSFLTVLAQSYGTGVILQDFINEADTGLQSINAWVSFETDGAINDLLPVGSINWHTRMVLVNAIHLKLPWATSFDPTDTAQAPFTRGDGTSVTTSFMNLMSTFPYTDDGQAQIVDLPLSGSQVSILIALPHLGVDLATYEAGLTTSSAAVVPPSVPEVVDLSLPKINITSAPFSLSGALTAMGMVDAFDATLADFTGMCANRPMARRSSSRTSFRRRWSR
jgi:serpin B